MDIDRRGDLWLGSSKSGLRIIRGAGFDVEQLPYLALVSGEQISHNTDITALHIDRDDGVWIATLTEGLLYYHPAMNKLRLINNKTTPGQRMPDQNIKCMVEQGDGTILLGTVRGLLRYDPLTGTIDIPYPRLAGELCIGLMRDSRGRIWLGTFQNGLFCIDGGQIRHYKYGAMPQVHISYYNSTPNLNNVRTFFEQRDGSTWVSVYGGIGRFDRQTGEVDLLAGRFPQIGRMMVVRNIEYLNDSTLFVASDNGMYLYDTFHDTATLDPPGFPASLRSARFNCTMTDRRGLLWMAVSEGLFVYDRLMRRGVRIEGLPSDNVYSVVDDARGEVWLSTFGNISKVAIAGTPESWEFTLTNFNSYDGVQASSFFEHSALCSSDGKVYFGGTHGMNVAEPEKIVYNTTDLRPQFTDLRLFNTPVERGARYGGRVVMLDPVNLTREVVLAHDQNFISIDFAGLNYVNPTQTYFRYRLEGLDERWTEIHSSNGQGRATYTSLPPGRYSLAVYAANNDKLWGSRPARMDIVIKPPLWGTAAARVFYCLLALAALWAVWLTMMRRAARRLREQRQVEALRQKEELDQLKFRFFTNISHELRTPLTLITVPLNTISRKISDPDIRSQLEVVQRNAGQLLSLINQLLDFRKLEMKGETLKLTGGYIDVFVEDIFRSFAELAAEKMVNYEFENRMDEHVSIYFDRAKLQRICNNLLSNAFKYTSGGGGVKLILEMIGDRIAITVADTGVGIPEEQLPHIFDRFYRIDDSRADSLTGSGIGLHLIREYVALHGGTIEVESRQGEGARFIVCLPANLAPDNFDQPIPHDDIPAPVAPPEQGERKTILLVEDNEEFRHYLKHELQERYRVIEAQNGEQGARQAVEQRPDLIITDMMMPVMDGVQMCRRLKNDIETSHIPLVLLTARQSDENKLEGYQAGADDYIAKPFNFDLLLLRVNNLIEQQRGRREAFARNIDVSPAKITITSLDELLVKKVLACVERNIDNPDYSVEQLSAEVNMHRMNLYRKLHSIVGQTPSEFIRAIRLKRAAQLLQQSRLPVTEIAEMVGFNTPKYFTRYFKQMFGTTPSAYAARFK